MDGLFFIPPQAQVGTLPILMGEVLTPVPAWPKLAAGQRGAAVAVLFIPPAPGQEDWRLVLTQRSTKVGSHKGQIAFAGGRRDPDDISPAATACREVSEEIGLEVSCMKIHGMLPPILSLDSTLVYPLVMTAAVRDEDFKINPSEVAQLILCSWREFAYSRHEILTFQLFGLSRDSHLFRTSHGLCVWGLTAKILAKAHLGTPLG